MKRLTKNQKRDIAAIAAKTDADIDFSDMPEIIDWTGAEIGKFYRPGKKPITIRLDEDVVDWLKSFGSGYQTRANQLLRHAMLSAKQMKPLKKGA
ncbi:MAG TPA: BrnA antitoxin family protein [Silvibacterium sp.]|nr:BrnA antitoxin family protein [Silvibacterium sp.]